MNCRCINEYTNKGDRYELLASYTREIPATPTYRRLRNVEAVSTITADDKNIGNAWLIY